ncbi:hypothetical protein H257_17501 [Aphanomyces astaci]|uniref:Tc1-like transposase DDE domain-containing protein n=1 Tax=Aphanomyces astaci TaxID=112090 RepID=W4FG91_APHAT|nr:hypothetical protein H257_17501 [Aphanomyces astaci]ETV65861.1 hypothetical protein H257_17501 [Aphanomyces astaci]|eukprot:XP_009844614.1 hypothetical protein H257_17501 [Aphanomyces astaci]
MDGTCRVQVQLVEDVDGHERQDVAEYRKVFCSTSLSLSERMASFSGEAMDILEFPNDVSQEQVVWMTHDESIFYANDDGGMVWTNTAHLDLPKKGRGRSIMVSDFVCPCHDRLFMLGDSEPLFITEDLHVGKAQEGYWTSEHVIKQVTQRVLPACAALHPGCAALFTFDQSTNHASYAADALRTSSMNLNPGGKQPRLRDGWYGSSQIDQAITFPEDHPDQSLRGLTKGVKSVLVERGAWDNVMLLTCGNVVSMPPFPELLRYCARHCLASHADFRSQNSILEEAAGHVCLFFPKYHCELNPIESYWGAAKRHARSNCDYSWNGLVQCVPRSLESVSLVSIRKFFHRCSHLIQAYSYGLEYNMSKCAHKQYKCHRRIPQVASGTPIRQQPIGCAISAQDLVHEYAHKRRRHQIRHSERLGLSREVQDELTRIHNHHAGNSYACTTGNTLRNECQRPEGCIVRICARKTGNVPS